MYNAITNSRAAFVELLDFTRKGSAPGQVKTNVQELEEIMGDRVKQYLGNTYKIFNEKIYLTFCKLRTH